MADTSVRVNVSGIKEVAQAFQAVDDRLPKELQKDLKRVADHVIGVAQQRMPYDSGTAAHSLKPRATGRGTASILFPAGGPDSRGDKDGYYPWLDFGGTTGRGHVANGHNGFGGAIKRTRVKGGRYLYPAIAESQQYISDAVDDSIERLAKEAGFDTEGHV